MVIHKFITEESVKKLCTKYGLIYGTIDRYIGTVPDKNLEDIEKFKIKEEDELWEIVISTFNVRMYGTAMVDSRRQISYSEVELYRRERQEREFNKLNSERFFSQFSDESGRQDIISQIYQDQFGSRDNLKPARLEIVAPLKDFNLQDHEIKDHKLLRKIEVKDPIVLKPVYFENQKAFLIVSAWGIEGSDELVKNENHN